MQHQLRLHLLGEPQIDIDGTPVTGFISSKAQALLIYLAAVGGTHTREKLATLFWDEMPEASAKKNLTKALSNLRKLVGDALQTDNRTAGLDWSANPFVDMHLLEDAISATPTSVGESEQSITPALLNSLLEVLALYKADFLSGFHVKDAPLFEEWVWMERERLHQLAIQGLLHATKHLIQHQNEEKAIPWLRRLLELDPLHEEGHLRLVEALAFNGQRGAALDQVTQCQRILDSELGVEPSAEFQALAERIQKSGEPIPHNIPSLAPIVGRDIESTEIRELLAEERCRLLTIAGPGGIGKTRLALEVASSFALADSSTQSMAPFPDGVFFASLAPVTTLDGFVAAICDAIEFAFRDDEPLRDQLASFLQRKELLIVLDNFEHLLHNPQEGQLNKTEHAFWEEPASRHNAASFLAAILSQAPDIKIITTSRIRLGIQTEHVFHLAGMEFPRSDSLPDSQTASAQAIAQPLNSPNESEEATAGQEAGQETGQGTGQEAATQAEKVELPSYGAVELFVQNACRLRPDFGLTTENFAAVTAICRQVSGMPLGILLAASWIPVLSPEEILAEISTNPDILETQEQDVPLRQRSIRAAFDYTWRMLTQREQEIYKKLSSFRGDFTRQAAQQIAGSSLRELMAMVDKSLIAPAQSGRFALHGLLRQFGIERLEEDPIVLNTVRARHCIYFASLMQQRAADFKGKHQEPALQETELDGEDIRAAWQWAVQRGQVDALSQFLDGLCQFYAWRGRFQEGETVAHRSSEAFDAFLATPSLASVANLESDFGFGETEHVNSSPSPDQLTVWGELHLAKGRAWHGEFARLLGRGKQAGQLLQQSQKQMALLAVEQPGKIAGLDLQAEQAFVYLHLGETQREQDRNVAQQHYEQSLALYRAAGDEWGAANALAALGWLVQHWGNYDEARQIYQEGLAIRRTLGDRRGLAESLRAVGGVALYQGDLEQAAQLIEQSIAIADELGDRVGRAAGLGKTGEIQIALGRFSEAQLSLGQAKGLYWDLGLPLQVAFVDAIRALAYLHLGFYDLAKNEADKALDFFQEEGAQRGIAYGSLVSGWVLLAQESTAAAKKALEEAVGYYELLNQRDELGQAHALLGLLHYQNNSETAAASHLRSAQTIAEEIHAFMPHILGLTVQVWHSEQAGNQRGVNWLRAQVAHQPIVAASRWFAELLPVPSPAPN